MKKVIITMDIGDFQVTDKEIRHILMDALYEFQSHRGPTSREYVNRRYPNTPEYSWLNREEKIKDTDKRKILAEIMRGSIEIE